MKNTQSPFSALWQYCSVKDQETAQAVRTVVLTPNRRLAVSISEEFDQVQQASGAVCWESLSCWSLNAWYEEAWQRWRASLLLSLDHETGDFDPMEWTLLSSFQELVLWEDVIRSSPEGENLLKVNGSAKLASGAHGLMCGWIFGGEGDSDSDGASDEHWANTTDCEAFVVWRKAFNDRCQSLGTLCSVELPNRLHDAPIWPSWFERLVLVGFDEVTPQTLRLLTHLEEQHEIEVIHLAEEGVHNAAPVRVEFETKEQELRYCANWAKGKLVEHSDQQLPSIAVVVPDLQDRRREVERVFRECFEGLPFNEESNELLAQLSNPVDAEHSNIRTESEPPQFNISGGEALSNYAIISSAFSILALLERELTMSTLSACLGSQFISGFNQEGSARAQLDVNLRKLRRDKLSLPLLLEESRLFVPQLTLMVEQLIALSQGDDFNIARDTKQPSSWLAFIEAVLQVVGWPGDRVLSSEEFQLVSKWRELLTELSSIDELVGEVGFSTVISLLRRLCNDTSFQIETKNSPPIQVLGILEAAAQNFDALWCMGLDSDTWPPSGYAHPFLPTEMQRSLNMPHSSAQREFDFAQTITEGFVSSAADVVFSSAQFSGDKELNVSPLIQKIPLKALPTEDLRYKADFKQHQKKALEEASSHSDSDSTKGKVVEVFQRDVMGPSLSEDQTVKGGTWILKAQADCPFKAFAAIRLSASSMDNPVFGMTAADRGSSMHRVMELFWNRCGSWEQLSGLSVTDKKGWLTEAAMKTVAEQAESSPEHMRGSVRYLEVERLVETATAWLALEEQREPFKVVAVEEKKEVTIGSIRLNTRADRIDRVGENGYVIIDYKTSEVSTQTWRDERLDEPQLPLYSVSVGIGAEPSTIQGVMFAQIKSGKMAIKGQHSDALTLLEKKSRDVVTDGEWDLTIATWRKRLESLANEFSEGYAEVLPKSIVKSCRFCDLQTLCRVSEGLLSDEVAQ